ncbi:ATP-grasp fold amidoligase family protein [Ammoniphilus sp. 3BR4]|uniref:ATP-grasp fold amidoligase family protein n=1 Tax=Ammoniphilus sp. 3BR4 TaxID=3158265 RepID=UPI0034658BB9
MDDDTKEHIKKRFKRILGYELNLRHPKTIQEKIQWIKIYGKLERFAKYTDKAKVRKFIRKRIGNEYLVPVFGVYKRVEDIDFDALPQSFVMKATHGSGWNIFVKDKSEINWPKAKSRMKKWLKSNWYDKSMERNYKPLKGRVMIEKFLWDSSGRIKEYKFQCFHGSRIFLRLPGHSTLRIYNRKGDVIHERIDKQSFHHPPEKPKQLEKMFALAHILAKDFPYVRVDFIVANGRIYVGELTFATGGGFLPAPKEWSLKLGSLLDLKRYV